MSKKIFVPILAGAVLLGGVAFYGVGHASAQETDGFKTVVQRIAERFNLNQTDVQKVFDDVHTERKAEMQKNLETRLTDAVKKGTITEAQKAAILEKHKEIQSFHESLKDVPETERKAKVLEFHNNLKSWAESQGLTEEKMKEIGFFGRFGAFKKGFHMGFWAGKHS